MFTCAALLELEQDWIEDAVPDSGRVRQQVADRDGTARRPQFEGSIRVDVGHNLQGINRRQISIRRIVKPETSGLHEHHDCCRGHRLAHRRDPEDRVLRQRGVVRDVALSSRMLEEDVVGIGHQHDHGRHVAKPGCRLQTLGKSRGSGR